MTVSERQFKDFLESTDETIWEMHILPNGIEPTVTNEPVNIVIVHTDSSDECGLVFGGIREDHYKKLYEWVFQK